MSKASSSVLSVKSKLLKERHQQAEEPFGEKKNAEQN